MHQPDFSNFSNDISSLREFLDDVNRLSELEWPESPDSKDPLEIIHEFALRVQEFLTVLLLLQGDEEQQLSVLEQLQGVFDKFLQIKQFLDPQEKGRKSDEEDLSTLRSLLQGSPEDRVSAISEMEKINETMQELEVIIRGELSRAIGITEGFLSEINKTTSTGEQRIQEGQSSLDSAEALELSPEQKEWVSEKIESRYDKLRDIHASLEPRDASFPTKEAVVASVLQSLTSEQVDYMRSRTGGLAFSFQIKPVTSLDRAETILKKADTEHSRLCNRPFGVLYRRMAESFDSKNTDPSNPKKISEWYWEFLQAVPNKENDPSDNADEGNLETRRDNWLNSLPDGMGSIDHLSYLMMVAEALSDNSDFPDQESSFTLLADEVAYGVSIVGHTKSAFPTVSVNKTEGQKPQINFGNADFIVIHGSNKGEKENNFRISNPQPEGHFRAAVSGKIS